MVGGGGSDAEDGGDGDGDGDVDNTRLKKYLSHVRGAAATRGRDGGQICDERSDLDQCSANANEVEYEEPADENADAEDADDGAAHDGLEADFNQQLTYE